MSEKEDCKEWEDHDWEDDYYGTRCKKCGLFFATGCAPWDYVGDEELDNDLSTPY